MIDWAKRKLRSTRPGVKTPPAVPQPNRAPAQPACPCVAYLAALRNSNKKGYAAAYHAFAIDHQIGQPRPADYGLSDLAAQALQLEIRARHGDATARSILGLS